MVCFRYTSIIVNTVHKGDSKDADAAAAAAAADDNDDNNNNNNNNTRKVPNQVATTNKPYWALHMYFGKHQCKSTKHLRQEIALHAAQILNPE